MKRRIIRYLCMNTGPVLQAVGILSFFVLASADMDRSPLGLLFGLLLGSLLMMVTGIYLEKVLPRCYRNYCRKHRRNREVYRLETPARKAA